MATNPDVYLLYEYMKKNAFTVRVKVNMTETVDVELLKEAAAEAMTRFPYYSVRVGLDDGENYILLPNDRPIVVLPEKEERLVLGTERVRGHLFAITWKDNTKRTDNETTSTVVKRNCCTGVTTTCNVALIVLFNAGKFYLSSL